MLLSTQTHVTARRFGDRKAVEMIAAAGFDAIDFTMFGDYNANELFSDGFEAYLEDIKRQALKCGVFFNQTHAPFPSYTAGDEEYNHMIYPRLIRAIEVTGILGAKAVIIHPVDFAENKKQKNLDMYNSLAPYAEKAGVKIALENMWGYDNRRNYIVHNVCSSPEEMIEYYDCLDKSLFTVCLDIGHCGLVGEDEANFIKMLGRERLGHLHVHDTDYKSDCHMLPFTRELDWKSVTAALGEINYSGEFTFEADETLERIPDGFFPTVLKFMHDTGRYLISMI